MMPRLAGTLRTAASSAHNIMKIQVRGRTQNTCYLPVCEAKIIEPFKDSQELCKAGGFLMEEYFPYEPLLMSNGIKPTQTLIQLLTGLANQGIMLYSITESKGVTERLGLVIAHQLHKSNVKELLALAGRIRDKPSKNYLVFLSEMDKKIDVMAQFKTQRVLNIDVIVTTKDFRRRGVSRLLLEGILDEAEKKEYEVVRLITGSEYMSKSSMDAGFTTVYSGTPEVLKDEKGEILLPQSLCIPHRDLKIMIIDLRKTSRKKPKKPEKPC